MTRTAVVGAGVVGLLTAWQLRLNGHAVTVIDPEPGRDASYAAAGMLAPISEVQYGQEKLWPMMTAARAEYPGFLARLERAAGMPAGYRENGTVLLAADRSDRDAVADLVSVQRAYGMEVEPLTTMALRRREPALAPGLAKGWDVPSDHQVDPRALVRCAIAALNAELGGADGGQNASPSAGPAYPGATEDEFVGAGPPVDWVTARATRTERAESGRTTLEWAPCPGASAGTPPPNAACGAAAEDAGTRPLDTVQKGGESPASPRSAEFDAVVLAAGMGHQGIAGLPQQAPLQLRPVHGDVLRLRVRPDQLLDSGEHLLEATVRAVVRGRSVYLVPRGPESTEGAGGLVVGASSREDGMAGTRAGSVQELLDDAVAVLPAVKDMELVEITTRARPGTPDERPFLGALPEDPGVVVSTGYSRHGILLAPLAARLGAALAAGEALGAEDRGMLEHMSLRRH